MTFWVRLLTVLLDLVDRALTQLLAPWPATRELPAGDDWSAVVVEAEAITRAAAEEGETA